MARLDWDRERRRRLSRGAAKPLSYEERQREREVAAAAKNFFTANAKPAPKRRFKRPASPGLRQTQRLKGRYTAKLPFLATIRAGDRVYAVEMSKAGLRFVRWGEADANG